MVARRAARDNGSDKLVNSCVFVCVSGLLVLRIVSYLICFTLYTIHCGIGTLSTCFYVYSTQVTNLVALTAVLPSVMPP